jgi:hypothetical protein
MEDQLRESSGRSTKPKAIDLSIAARSIPRFVIEGSFQFPVVRNRGPLVLRTNRNILLGVKYLF